MKSLNLFGVCWFFSSLEDRDLNMHRLTVMFKCKYALNLTPGQHSGSFAGKSWQGLHLPPTAVPTICQQPGSTHAHLLIEAKKMTEPLLLLGERLSLLQQKEAEAYRAEQVFFI